MFPTVSWTRVCACVLAAGVLTSASAVLAQAPRPADKKQAGTDQILPSRGDGWPIHVTYYEATAGKESPVAVLIPGAEGPEVKDARTRRVFEKTALELQKNGFAVVTVDLRKHGDSVPATDVAGTAAARLGAADYTLMAASDLEAVKDFLLKEHQNEKLNVRKLGIVAVGSSAMVATAFTVADWEKTPYPDAPTLAMRTPRGQDVRALMLISPKASVKGLNSNNVLRSLRGLLVAVHVLASSSVKSEARDAEKIFKAVELKPGEPSDVRKTTMAPMEISAERFLEGKEADTTNKLIVDFLNQNVKNLDEPWRSRKSRL